MNLYYLFIALTFVAVVLFLEGAYLAWNSYKGPESRRIERRLRSMSAGAHGGKQASILKQRLLSETPAMERLLLRIPRIHRLDRLLQQSGLNWSVAFFLGASALAGLGCFLAGAMLSHLAITGIVLGAAGAVLPLIYVLRAKRKRLLKIEQQLPEALDLIGRALRAGHALQNGLKMVGDEMADPIAAEFRITSDEVNFGIAMQDALVNLTLRVPSTDLRYFVIAVLIQRESGGNLTELLDNISAIIRARQKLVGTIRVLSADGRMSAWILSILPFALAGIINIINPNFLAPLWNDPVGVKMVMAGTVMMALGIFWMRRIIKIRV
ncbi:MAG: type II secretion system F family protein [Sulfuricella sp.]|nr:type II secretion system F family protein [Sulfuricella sp.]